METGSALIREGVFLLRLWFTRRHAVGASLYVVRFAHYRA